MKEEGADILARDFGRAKVNLTAKSCLCGTLIFDMKKLMLSMS